MLSKRIINLTAVRQVKTFFIADTMLGLNSVAKYVNK